MRSAHHRCQVGARRGTELYDQDSAHARHLSALIVEGRRPFRIPQLAVVELVRVRANSEHRIERIKDRPCLRLRKQAPPAGHASRACSARRGAGRDKERVHRGDAGRNQTFGVVSTRVPYRGDRGEPMCSRCATLRCSGNTILRRRWIISSIRMASPMRSAARLCAAGGRDAREIEQRTELRA